MTTLIGEPSKGSQSLPRWAPSSKARRVPSRLRSGTTRRPPAFLMMLVVAASAMLPLSGCRQSQQNGTGTGGNNGTGGVGGSGPSSDAGMERAGDAGDASPADAGVDANAGTGGSPFGIATRPLTQTCTPPASADLPVDRLSATGCVDATDAKKAAASMIPYEVNSPLWSDGADKQRFMAIPDGALIHVKDCAREPTKCLFAFQGGTSDDEGHWELPVGTVLMKHFLFAGKFLETRLFIRFADLWAGFSYQWNSDQTDALLVSENGLKTDITNSSGGTQSWSFPSRSDCLQCHNDTVGGSLGPETRQFDRMFKYPSGVTANQIDTLEHIGLFDAPVVRMPPLTDYTRDTSPGNLEARARSYLHANCAICHRPDGAYSAIDLRFGVTLATMNVCNVDPNKGDQGVPGAKRVFPAMPDKSVMLLRMQAPDMMNGRMPQLATSVLDTNGIDTISAWINSITTCP